MSTLETADAPPLAARPPAHGIVAVLPTHVAAAALLGIAYLSGEAHPAAHAGVGAGVSALLVAVLLGVATVGWLRGRSRREAPVSLERSLRSAARVLFALGVLGVLGVAASGAWMSDDVWGARALVSETHEALAAGLPWGLALLLATEIAVRWRER